MKIKYKGIRMFKQKRIRMFKQKRIRMFKQKRIRMFKQKRIRVFKQIRRMMSLAMLMPSFLLAVPDYKQKFTQILDLQ
ncbi:hypothetical protein JP0074_06500 [Helicobacter pylori]|nr:hypothetical protein JP0074_06500 [Helicobacter pylori]